jgi:hypothetical protein
MLYRLNLKPRQHQVHTLANDAPQPLRSARQNQHTHRIQGDDMPRNLFGYFFREKSKIISNSLLFWLGFMLLGGAGLPTLGCLLTG